MNEEKSKVFHNQHILVLGMAKSGFVAAQVLHSLGAKVIVNEKKPREEVPEAATLEEMGIQVHCGGHPEEVYAQPFDLVVKNPGIPYDIPPIRWAQEHGIPIITEVEFASRLTESSIIGITGSNGKTTTTTLVGEMLAQSGLPVHVAGNIGTVLTSVAMESQRNDWLVTELSSFQLEGTSQFYPHIAALLNIFDAHLDFHKTKEAYIAAKMKLFQNQTSTDWAIFNGEQEISYKLAKQVASQVCFFHTYEEVEQGAYLKNGKVYFKYAKQVPVPIIEESEIQLKGMHNIANILAAICMTLLAGGKVEAIQQVLRNFQGVEHRLEYVRTLQDVRYYNDSKATNVEAAIQAVSAFDEPLIWIAGGLDRGHSFEGLRPYLQHVRAMVVYGQTAERFKEFGESAQIPTIIQVNDVKAAVTASAKLANKGDVVLLSPACASWDMYSCFEERGHIFKEAVHNL